MFKDKHVVIAMLVAPVLAIIAWYGVDQIVAEDPHAAQAGAAYSLVAKSNCRYASGRCDLENGEFKISLLAGTQTASTIAIELEAELGLQSAHIGLLIDGIESSPLSMQRADENGLMWRVEIPAPAADAELRIVAQANDAIWFAEVPTVFLEPAAQGG